VRGTTASAIAISFFLVIEDAQARRARFARIQFHGRTRRILRAAGLNLRDNDVKTRTVTNALLDNRQHVCAGEIRQKIFERDHALLEFAGSRSFGQIIKLPCLLKGKFTDGSAADFGKMRARADLFAHFLSE